MSNKTTPRVDGFHMPGEYEPHSACIMIWPTRPGSWIYGAKRAREAFLKVACAISQSEEVYFLVSKEEFKNAEEMLLRVEENQRRKIHLVEMETDDAWARDVGPTFVINQTGQVRGIDWKFNAWGGEVDGLYSSWDKDDRVAKQFCKKLGVSCYDAHPFVLEGGSIHSDGEGTLMVTESCLLSKGRNPDLSKAEIEAKLLEYCGAKKVLWLPHGIYMDETNEHVDNICAFVKPGEVVLAWTDEKEDPQYPMSLADFQYLENERDAKGRKLIIHKLPIPQTPICLTEEEVAGFSFEEGEDTRETGERMAASYVNFYISNDGIILPQFGDPNDQVAVRILENCFPERKIYPIPARDILVGGGNIHCITQQIPMSLCDCNQ